MIDGLMQLTQGDLLECIYNERRNTINFLLISTWNISDKIFLNCFFFVLGYTSQSGTDEQFSRHRYQFSATVWKSEIVLDFHLRIL